MSLALDWKITKAWINNSTGLTGNVDFMITMTDEDLPGVSTDSGGTITLIEPLEASATRQQIIDAVIASLGERFGHILDFSSNDLKFRYSKAQAKAVSIYDGVNSVNADDVAQERNRRMAKGFAYTFADSRGTVWIGTTPEDMVGWDRVTKLKDALYQLGDSLTRIKIAVEGGRIIEVTGPEWNAILLYEAAMFEQPLWQASFTLQAMQPIPADYTDNKYWPA
jgi:hypothetical protein